MAEHNGTEATNRSGAEVDRLELRPTVSRDVMIRREGDGYLVTKLGYSPMFVNELTFNLIQMSYRNQSVRSMVEYLIQQCEIDAETAFTDIWAALTRLYRAGYLVFGEHFS